MTTTTEIALDTSEVSTCPHSAAERAIGVPIPTPEFDSAIAAIRPKTA